MKLWVGWFATVHSISKSRYNTHTIFLLQKWLSPLHPKRVKNLKKNVTHKKKSLCVCVCVGDFFFFHTGKKCLNFFFSSLSMRMSVSIPCRAVQLEWQVFFFFFFSCETVKGHKKRKKKKGRKLEEFACHFHTKEAARGPHGVCSPFYFYLWRCPAHEREKEKRSQNVWWSYYY